MLKFVSVPLTIMFVLVGTFFLFDYLRRPSMPAYERVVFDTDTGEVSVRVATARTESERAKGLSGRAAMGEDEGLLFVFDASGFPVFWMKDMLFPIDIIWIGDDLRVADITANLATSTYPDSVMPSSAAQYVLEVNAGFAGEHGIMAGTHARLE